MESTDELVDAEVKVIIQDWGKVEDADLLAMHILTSPPEADPLKEYLLEDLNVVLDINASDIVHEQVTHIISVPTTADNDIFTIELEDVLFHGYTWIQKNVLGEQDT